MKKIIIAFSCIVLIISIFGVVLLNINEYYKYNKEIEILKREELLEKNETTEIEKSLRELKKKFDDVTEVNKEKVEVYEKWKEKNEKIEVYLEK